MTMLPIHIQRQHGHTPMHAAAPSLMATANQVTNPAARSAVGRARIRR
ncbi:hypothetical protein [Comamonas serinivorans]|nr:hypothetical protein [Comamonas serinivorans]